MLLELVRLQNTTLMMLTTFWAELSIFSSLLSIRVIETVSELTA